MITAWIIQPQINKLAEQKRQLDSLRVDIKVETIIIKREIAFKKMVSAQKEFEKVVEAIKRLRKLFENFNRSIYPNSSYMCTGINTKPGLQQGIYNEFIYTPKKNINGNN